MKDKVFIDTNIWLYGLTESDLNIDKTKREVSLSLFENLLKQGADICISVQVINECHWNFVRKFKVKDEFAARLIKENIIPISKVRDVTFNTYELSNQLRHKYALSFWDSLIVASALECNCSVLYTEDMQNGLRVENKLKIVNPFVAGR